MDCIEREKAIEIIEEKQKELCPVGKYGRGYVYGADREEYDKWEEVIRALENIQPADTVEIIHAHWEPYHKSDFGWDEYGKRCTNCKLEIENENFNFPKDYCPRCGAKMG